MGLVRFCVYSFSNLLAKGENLFFLCLCVLEAAWGYRADAKFRGFVLGGYASQLKN